MDLSYGIAVNNRYGLFYDENEDPMDALKAASQPKEAAKVSKAADTKPQAGKPAEVKGKAATAVAPASAGVKKAAGPKETQAAGQKAPVDGQNKPREDRSGLGPRPPRVDRGGRTAPGSAGPREERNNRRNDDRPRDFGSVGNTESSPGNGDGDYRPRTAYRGERSERGTYRGSGERGGGRGRGGMRNARGGPGMQDNRGKRDFDRQSGSDKSGVKPIEKREGSGSHNWGSVQDEIEGQLEPTVVEEAAEGDADVAAIDGTEAKDGEGDAAPAVAEEDQEPKELTLDEYRALRGERKKPEFNIRKPGEGEDNSQWKKTFVLDKKPIEDDQEEEIIDLTAEYPQRAGRQKRLDIEIRFADSRRGAGGFEGRGGGRGRGRGGRGGEGGGFRREDRGEGGGYRREDRGEGERRPYRDRGDGERQDRPYQPRGDGEQREGGGFRGGYRGADRGGYRGGRGGGERRGGFGGAARGPAMPAAPKVDDEKDFPALG